MKFRLFALIILLMAIQTNALDRKQYVFYWGDYDAYAARFDVSDSTGITGFNLLMYGDSVGSFRVRILGDEAGSSYPVLYKDQLKPITLIKSMSGYQEFRVAFDEPIKIDYPQFYILIDSVSPGITLVSDKSEHSSVCTNKYHELFLSQLLHSKSQNKWIYGKYSFIIEPNFSSDVDKDNLFKFDEKINDSFSKDTLASNKSISIDDFNHDGFLDILYGGRLYLNKQGTGFDSLESNNYREKAPMTNIVLDENSTTSINYLLFNCLSDNNSNLLLDELNNTQKFSLESDLKLSPISYSVTDLNKDGESDIVLVNRSNTSNDLDFKLIILFNRHGSFDPIVVDNQDIKKLLCTYSSVLVSDFNHDGNADIFITGNSTGAIITYDLNQGSFLVKKLDFKNVDTNPDLVLSGTRGSSLIDFNHDGIEDIICVANKISDDDDLIGDAVVYFLDETGTITGSKDLNLGIEENQSIATGDIDNNGEDDFLVSTSCSCKRPQIYLAENQYFKNVTAKTGIYEDNLGDDALLEDINNDGKLDLISIHGKTLKVYTNQIQNAGNFVEFDFSGLSGQYRVETYSNNLKLSKTLVRGRGYLVQGSPRLYFGLGGNSVIDSFKLYKNENLKFTNYNLPLNKIYKIKDMKADLYEQNSEIEVSIIPNPFSEETKFICNLSTIEQPIHAFITDANGSIIKEFINGLTNTKTLEIIWNGLNNSNDPTSNGLYIFHLVQGINTKIIKAIKLN